MSGIIYYEDIKVSLIQKPENPLEILSRAASMTMKKDYNIDKKATSKLVKFLIEAEHTSILEHLNYTFVIDNCSRSYLTQITRHRVASYTSASQHYQDYRNYPIVVSKDISDMAINSIESSLFIYESLIESGIKKEEARQVLTNSMAVNLMMTINARSLYNLIKQRRCKRNVEEMVAITNKMLKLLQAETPEIFNHYGTWCDFNVCNQGKMSCGNPYNLK